MGIKYDATVLITDKFEEMKKFYIDKLGQSVKMDFGNCIALKCGISLWKLEDEYPITSALGYKYHNSPNKNLEICFETDSFNKEVTKLKKGKLALLHDVKEETWGQMTIRFYDPDNNLVELGESIPSFCQRLYNSGMDKNEVAKKTGISHRGN